MLPAFVTGFALSLSLILAIGPQNAFVLRQGILGAHVFAICLVCALSDAVLMAAGVAGFAALTEAVPGVARYMAWVGAAFLTVYGGLAFRAALRGGAALDPAARGAGALWAALGTTLALTWLNPHVYLDTLVLVGSVATRFPGQGLAFWAGASVSSALFFFALGYGAALLRPVFARPRAWQALDLAVAGIMWSIAAGLILSA